MTVTSSPLLRRALLADAALTGAAGLMLLFAATALSELLALPRPLLFWAGLVLLPFAAVVAAMGMRERAPRAAIWAVVAANAIWALDSVLNLVLGWVEPNALGSAFILAQAVAVGVFAELQYLGMRRAPALA